MLLSTRGQLGGRFFWVNFRPLQEIEAIMGGGQIFDSGPFFTRLRYVFHYKWIDYTLYQPSKCWLFICNKGARKSWNARTAELAEMRSLKCKYKEVWLVHRRLACICNSILDQEMWDTAPSSTTERGRTQLLVRGSIKVLGMWLIHNLSMQ